MKYDESRLKYLILKSIKGELTPEEKNELDYFKNFSDEIKDLIEKLQDKNYVKERMEKRMAIDDEAAYYKFMNTYLSENANVVSIKKNWWKPVAAASVILIIAAGSYFIFYKKNGQQGDVAPTSMALNGVEAPKSNRAMITLSNGKTVYLDSTKSEQLARQGNVELVKLPGGEVVYRTSGEVENSSVAYNTLFNPKGSRVTALTLTDGTRVYLNAESSIKYPVVFTGNERRIEITGEAYFEVAHDASKPFKVIKEDMEISVLGTIFNVNAYDDEDDIRVTLLEGSVKVNRSNSSGLLKPGQQARLTDNIKVVNDIDMEAVIAWKNDKFNFGQSASTQAIMRQVARWYDIEIVYEGKIEDRQFVGKISRMNNAKDVLALLAMTGGIQFKIEGKKIIVSQ